MPNLKPLTMLFVAAILALPMGAQATSQHIYGDQFITTMQGQHAVLKERERLCFQHLFPSRRRGDLR
jgi:hypothetical protein